MDLLKWEKSTSTHMKNDSFRHMRYEIWKMGGVREWGSGAATIMDMATIIQNMNYEYE